MVRNIAISVSAYLSVCLYVCMSVGVSEKILVQTTPNFRHVFPVAVARSCLILRIMRYVMYHWFCGRHHVSTYYTVARYSRIRRMLKVTYQEVALGRSLITTFLLVVLHSGVIK